MIYALVFLSIIFLGIGFAINKRNAGYLLAGYNTLSDDEKERIDLDAYLITFKKFHFFLGSTSLIFGLAFYYIFGEDFTGLFIALYPILAYTALLLRGRIFFKSPLRKLAISMLLFSLFIVVVLFRAGQKETQIIFHEKEIQITGIYGESIKNTDLEYVELVQDLPNIKLRVNGFSLSTIKKGVFKTSKNKKVKLFIQNSNGPYIKISKKQDKELYFNSKNEDTQQIFIEIENWMND